MGAQFQGGRYIAGSVLQLVESSGRWRLLVGGLPIFWFPEKSSALEIARVMADAQHQFDGRPTRVQVQDTEGAFELVITCG